MWSETGTAVPAAVLTPPLSCLDPLCWEDPTGASLLFGHRLPTAPLPSFESSSRHWQALLFFYFFSFLSQFLYYCWLFFSYPIPSHLLLPPAPPHPPPPHPPAPQSSSTLTVSSTPGNTLFFKPEWERQRDTERASFTQPLPSLLPPPQSLLTTPNIFVLFSHAWL